MQDMLKQNKRGLDMTTLKRFKERSRLEKFT